MAAPSLLDVVTTITHPGLPVDALTPLACASKTFAAAIPAAIDKKRPLTVGQELFSFVRSKPTTVARNRLIKTLPLEYLKTLFRYIGAEFFSSDKACFINSSEIGLSIEMAVMFPSMFRIFNIVFEDTLDFAATVEFDDFYSNDSPSHVMHTAIRAFDAFTKVLVEEVAEKVNCDVLQYDWVAHGMGFVQMDFINMVHTCSRTVTIRRSRLPHFATSFDRRVFDIPLNHGHLIDIISTMFEFIPV